MSHNISIPTEWTLLQFAWVALVAAILIFGIVWTLVHSRNASSGEKTVWVLVQILLPVLGFVVWIIAARKTRSAPRSQ